MSRLEGDAAANDHYCDLPNVESVGQKFRCSCGTLWEVQDSCVYGFPCVENPHDFSPDRESCTPAEIEFHENAKRRWDAGERDVRGARCETIRNEAGDVTAHYTRTSWGIGVNSVTDWEVGESR